MKASHPVSGSLRAGCLVVILLALAPLPGKGQEGGRVTDEDAVPVIRLFPKKPTPPEPTPAPLPPQKAEPQPAPTPQPPPPWPPQLPAPAYPTFLPNQAIMPTPPAPPAPAAAAEKAEPKPTPAPPQQLPPFPPGLGTLGYPPHPAVVADKDAPAYLDKYLTVKLRDSGTLRLYGFFRGDLDFATSRFNDLQNRFFVLPDDARFKVGPGQVANNPNNFNYSIYPRLTRGGVEYYGKPVEGFCDAEVGGRIEIDFQTLGFEQNPESRKLLRLRLAYLTVRVGDWHLTVGQAWDVISPLLPTANDNGLNWYAGNLGDRRPMVKLFWDHDLEDGVILQWHQALSLGNAVTSLTDVDRDGLRDQEATGIPAYQARLGALLPSAVEGRKIIAGVWGEACKEKETVGPIGTLNRRSLPSYLMGVDLRVPLYEWVTFQGEAFIGRNIEDWRGGINQGENLVTGQTILSRGFWAELVFHYADWHQITVGYSTDDPLNREVEQGGRTRNSLWYVSNRFPVGGGLVFGLDFESWYTTYKGFQQGDAAVVKFFAQLNF